MLEELTEDNLAELIKDQPLAYVQYSAGWCGNCRIMKPKFKKFSAEMDPVPFYIIDSEKIGKCGQFAYICQLQKRRMHGPNTNKQN